MTYQDQLIDLAYDYLCEGGDCSASNLQRKLGIGYNRAAKIIQELVDTKKLIEFPQTPRYVIKNNPRYTLKDFLLKYSKRFPRSRGQVGVISFSIYELRQKSDIGFSEIADILELTTPNVIKLYQRAALILPPIFDANCLKSGQANAEKPR